jgi:hypothetical protein
VVGIRGDFGILRNTTGISTLVHLLPHVTLRRFCSGPAQARLKAWLSFGSGSITAARPPPRLLLFRVTFALDELTVYFANPGIGTYHRVAQKWDIETEIVSFSLIATPLMPETGWRRTRSVSAAWRFFGSGACCFFLPLFHRRALPQILSKLPPPHKPHFFRFLFSSPVFCWSYDLGFSFKGTHDVLPHILLSW